MPLENKQLYEFKEFRLNVKEKILLRGDEQIPLTPKVFETLCLFVENAGRLIEKGELMEKLWGDSFVEESNLTFNIRQLRIALNDNIQNPIFIKTVPRHGYRFIAEVKVIKEETAPQTTDDISRVVSQNTAQSFSQHISKPNYFFIGLAVLLILGLVGALFLLINLKEKRPNAPILSAPFALEKISTNGKTVLAVISPDGKKVIYTNGRGSDKQSVWMRNLEDGSNTNIIPPSDDYYLGLAISPDGETIYFPRRQRLQESQISIYRVPIFGGIPQKITDNNEGWISISPDGTKISFIRCLRQSEDYCSLYIANASDGQNERKIYTSSRPFRIGDNQFSRDGKKVAFAVGQSINGANEFGLMEVDLESGTSREILKEKFFNIKNVVWLPDQNGLLITARKATETNFRIMLVSAVTGETELLTKDSDVYSFLSLDNTATKLICTKVKQDFKLKLLNLENPAENRVLTDATSVTFAPDGKIYFASGMSGNSEIWSVSSDGNNQRQLTNNPAEDSMPFVSPDGNSIFFISSRTGAAQIWRMNADGSNQTQITQTEGGKPLFISPDGNWIYYHQSISKTLWRIDLKTREEKPIFNKSKSDFGISPDGTKVTYSEKQGDETVLEIADLKTGQTIKTFPLVYGKSDLQQISWMPDGKSIFYVTDYREFQGFNVWKQPIDNGSPTKIAAIGDVEIGALALPISSNSKTFAIIQGEWLHDAVLIKGLK